MIVRGLTPTGDWTFGKGKNDYKSGNAAVSQMIQTRVKSFLNDCFFATNDGIDWFNLLGAKNQAALQLAIAGTILNTDGVSGILQLNVNLSNSRELSVAYSVQTIYSQTLNGIFSYSMGVF